MGAASSSSRACAADSTAVPGKDTLNDPPFQAENHSAPFLLSLQDWDDDNINDDFSQRLKAELAKQQQQQQPAP